MQINEYQSLDAKYEHDDDVTSQVTQDAEEETERFPVTGDELEDEREGEDEETNISENESER